MFNIHVKGIRFEIPMRDHVSRLKNFDLGSMSFCTPHASCFRASQRIPKNITRRISSYPFILLRKSVLLEVCRMSVHRSPPVISSSSVRSFDRIDLPHSSSHTKSMWLLTDFDTTTMAPADSSTGNTRIIANQRAAILSAGLSL